MGRVSLKFRKCLRQKKIRLFSRAKSLVPKELILAKSDLEEAQITFVNSKNYKWVTIQAYYSMFHTARALLYAQGYREKSHYCLNEAIREFYVNKRLLNCEHVEALQMGKILRENADYQGEFSKSGASDMLKSAERFFQEAKNILKN